LGDAGGDIGDADDGNGGDFDKLRIDLGEPSSLGDIIPDRCDFGDNGDLGDFPLEETELATDFARSDPEE
jgi:hypothetical protein